LSGRGDSEGARRSAGGWILPAGLGLLIVLALALLGLRLALPRIVQEVAQRILSNEGREVTIEEVSLDFMRGRVSLEGVSLRGREPRVEFAQVERLSAAIDWRPLLERRVLIESITIDAPTLWIAYDEEANLNWAVFSGEPDVPEQEPEPAAAFDVRVEKIELGAGRLFLRDDVEDGLPDLEVAMGAIRFEGLAVSRPERGGELAWGLAGIDASDWKFDVLHGSGQRIDFDLRARAGPIEPGGRIPIEFGLSREGGYSIDIEGELQPEPFEFAIAVQWRELPTRGLLGLLSLEGVQVHEGGSTGDLDLRFSLDSGPERGLVASGRVEHDALTLALDGDPALRVEVEKARVELTHLFVPVPDEENPSFESLRVHIKELELVRPEIEITLAAPAPVARSGQDPLDASADREPSAPQPPLAIRVDSFSLRQGQLNLLDLDLDLDHGGGSGQSQRVTDIEVDARSILWPLEESRPGEAPPMEASLTARWAGLESQPLARLAQVDGVRISRGTSHGEVKVDLIPGEGAKASLRVEGELTHDALVLRTVGEDPVELEVEQIELTLDQLSLALEGSGPAGEEPIVVHVGSIGIHAPSLFVPLAGAGAGADDAAGRAPVEVQDEPTPKSANEDASASLFEARLGRLILDGGSVRWSDPSLGSDHSQSLTGIELRADSVRWPELGFDRASLVVGSLGSKPLKFEGSLDSHNADFELQSTRIAIAPWNREISHYSDYSVTKGEVSINGPMRVRGDVYEAPIQVVIRDLEMTNRNNAFETTFGVKLSAAIKLLRDPAGIIHLQLPLKGTASEGATVDLAVIIQDAIREAIVNALASASAVGVDLAGASLRRVTEVAFRGIGEVAFTPGSTEVLRAPGLVLKSAAEFVNASKGAKLQLIARVVTDDLKALGIKEERKGSDLLNTLGETGRAIFGGSRELESEVEKSARKLAEERLESVEEWVVRHTALSRDRIVRVEWEGRAHEGDAGVVLRMQVGE